MAAYAEESPGPASHHVVPAAHLEWAARWGRAPTGPINLNAADRAPVLFENLEVPLVQSGSLDVRNRLAGLVGYFEANEFVFAGKVGTGFDTNVLLELRARLDTIETLKSPFTKAVGLPRVRAHWVQPQVVVRVAFIEWTTHGKLRHSRFLGVNTEKLAREVVREMS